MAEASKPHDYGVGFGGDAKRRMPSRRTVLEKIMVRIKGEIRLSGAQSRSVEFIVEEELRSFHLGLERLRKRNSYLERKLQES